MVELDGQGRILIQPILREAAQMKGDVDVMGNLTYLDVWNHARFLENHEQEPDYGRGREDAGRAGHLALSAGHTPVMAEEAVRWLRVEPGGTYLDATVGLGATRWKLRGG